MGKLIPFNPLDKKNLAASIENALTSSKALPLNNLQKFEGSGLYSLYYKGDFAAYAPLAKANERNMIYPIYVGKAESPGSRKGGFLNSSPSGAALYHRLNEHAKSIEQAVNLDIKDFLCRYLIVDDFWISLGESLLIAKYAPVWNTLIEGFGNHDPGKGRRSGARPVWDMLHPGRIWASLHEPNQITAEQISADALQYLAARHPLVASDADSVIYQHLDIACLDPDESTASST